MILIIAAWIFYFLLMLSIGVGLHKLIQKYISSRISFDPFHSFWFGFVFLIALLQILSLFFPINGPIFFLITILGIASALFNFRSALNALGRFWNKLFTAQGFVYYFIILVMAIMVAYSANKEIDHADTFIYHFNAVRWVKEYSAVPGLANLHHRLGFNSSFFLYAALTDIGMYTNESAHIAVSFLLIVCMIHWLTVIINSQESIAKRIFCLLSFSYLLIHGFWRTDINSLATDCPTAVLTLEFCLLLIDNNYKQKLILLLPLAATIFAFKLSGMLAVGISLIVLAGYIIKWRVEIDSQKENRKVLFSSVVFFGVVVVGFIARNAIVSGWLLYPFPVGNLHLPWSAPKEHVVEIMEWIKSYPKLPGGASPTTIKEHDFFYWFLPWFDRFRQTTEFNLFCVAAVLIGFSLLNVKSLIKFCYARLNLLLVVVFALSSLLFWFLSAPDFRFGSIYFYILISGAAVLANESSRLSEGVVKIVFVAFIYLFVREMNWFVLDRAPTFFTFSYTKPVPVKREVASPPGEKPEFVVYLPVEGDACGNSPLPCGPYPGRYLYENRGVRQRVPGDISKGFISILK